MIATRVTCPHCRQQLELDEDGVPVPLSRKREEWEALKADAREVLHRLNAIAGTHFRPTETNIRLIMDRLMEGYSVTDLGRIITAKAKEWKDDATWSRFLRPVTLFNKSKAAQYIGQIGGRANGEG